MEQTLQQALDAARTADASERIRFRDAIATHGQAGIEAVAPWLTDSRLGYFAGQVIWKAGDLGERDMAVKVLREALDDPTVAMSRDDTAMLLHKLGYSAPKPAAYRRKPSSIPSVAGTGWPGFRAREFETTDGTFWRSRTGRDSMVPHVLRPLREIDPMFESWSVYHSPEVQFAVKDRYVEEGDPAQGWRAAKLVVYAHGHTPEHPDAARQVTVGLYIEKGDGSEPYGAVDDRWDWPEFIRLLRVGSFRAALERLMVLYGLRIGDYWAGNRFFEGAANTGFVALLEGDALVVRQDGQVIGEGWDALCAKLESLPEDEDWQDLHIWRSWPAQEAIDSGVGFARTAMVPALRDIAALYLRIVERHRWSSASR